MVAVKRQKQCTGRIIAVKDRYSVAQNSTALAEAK
jgi:hypothetical protein